MTVTITLDTMSFILPSRSPDKREFKGFKYNLSNFIAQPLSMLELLKKVRASGDTKLIDAYLNHNLPYVLNGGSLDLRRDIARIVYDDKLSTENMLILTGAQSAV